MSVDINWAQLISGSDGIQLAETIRVFIHDRFQQIELPGFIRAVQVHAFEFGTEAPTVEITDISDPLPDFYEDDSSSDDGEPQAVVESCESMLANKSGLVEQIHERTHVPSMEKLATQPPRLTRVPTDITLPRWSIPSPALGTGTSSLGYFHLPLNTSLSGSLTPTPFSPQWPVYQTGHGLHARGLSTDLCKGLEALSKQPEHQRDDPTTRPGTAKSNEPLEADHVVPQEVDSDSQRIQHETASSDCQTTFHISYDGSLSLSLTAEILLDYPMPSFVGIPLKLRITGLKFDGVALLAFLQGKSDMVRISDHQSRTQDESRSSQTGKLKFCFLAPEDAKLVIDPQSKPASPTKDLNLSNSIGGLVQEIRVESEIGRKENGRQVLKNVGKVEKFIVDQIKRIFEDEFVFPSFWTFLV